jgi:hypothetical protein
MCYREKGPPESPAPKGVQPSDLGTSGRIPALRQVNSDNFRPAGNALLQNAISLGLVLIRAPAIAKSSAMSTLKFA